MLEKHRRYRTLYKPNELYWGIGIECETYLTFERPVNVASTLMRTAHRPERYSVDYYKHSFKDGYIHDIEAYVASKQALWLPLPLFLNAHALTKTDTNGQHKTTYEKQPKPNPRFNGTTLFEHLIDFSQTLKNTYETSYTFDGDTIEFITQDFYKTTADRATTELITQKETWLQHFRVFCQQKRLFRQYGAPCWPRQNPGFAVFWTNPKNIVMFNNGTYHINLTAPAELGPPDEHGVPTLAYPDLFRFHHQKIIRLFQWLEPLLVAVYGTPDPLSATSPKYSKASQRCAVSRYIGIGTYDSAAMPEGKCLTLPIDKIRGSHLPYWWYSVYHMTSGYKILEKIGLDINYKKHWNHGIELRIFDWFPEDRLNELLEILIRTMDVALQTPLAEEACLSREWNAAVVQILQEGPTTRLPPSFCFLYSKLFGLPLTVPSYRLCDYWEWLCAHLKTRSGICSHHMLGHRPQSRPTRTI